MTGGWGELIILPRFFSRRGGGWLPSPRQHAQPVSPAHLLDQRLAEAVLAHRLNQNRQSGGIAEFGRDHGAVEIGAEADAVLAGMFEHVLDMLDDESDRRVPVVAAVRTQEARGEIDTGKAAGFRRSLPIAGPSDCANAD